MSLCHSVSLNKELIIIVSDSIKLGIIVDVLDACQNVMPVYYNTVVNVKLVMDIQCH